MRIALQWMLAVATAACIHAATVFASGTGTGATVLPVDSSTLTWVPLSSSWTMHAPNGTAAVCGDGSLPGYWISYATAQAATKGATAAWSSGWVVYLEGGAACVDHDSCWRRTFAYPQFMTSNNVSQTIRGENAFSADPTQNPELARYNKVFVHYCSSDFWVGSAPAPAFDPQQRPLPYTGASPLPSSSSSGALAALPSLASLSSFAGMPTQQLKDLLRPVLMDPSMPPLYAQIHAQPSRPLEQILPMHPRAAALVGNNSVVLLLLGTPAFISAVIATPDAVPYLLYSVPYFAGHRIVAGLLQDLLNVSVADSTNSFAGYPVDRWTGSAVSYGLAADFMQRTGLTRPPSLIDATDIVIMGSSAGGVGALNHAEFVEQVVLQAQQQRAASSSAATNATTLPSLQQVRVLVDSGWFLDYQGSLGIVSAIGLKSWKVPVSDFRCIDPSLDVLGVSAGGGRVPCCLLASCLATRVLPERFHVLFVQSMYDAFILSLGASQLMGNMLPSLLPASITSSSSSDSSTSDSVKKLVDFVSTVSMYGGAYNQSFQLAGSSGSSGSSGRSNLHFFVPSCFQHVYLPNQHEDYTAGLDPVYLHVTYANWNGVVVKGASVSRAVSRWVTRSSLAVQRQVLLLTGEAPAPVRIMDDCAGGPQCNPTCPDELRAPDQLHTLSAQLAAEHTMPFASSAHAFRQALVALCWIWMSVPIVAQWLVWILSICFRRRFIKNHVIVAASPTTKSTAASSYPASPSAASSSTSPAAPSSPTASSLPSLSVLADDSASMHFGFEDLYYWPVDVSSALDGAEKADGVLPSAAATPIHEHVAPSPSSAQRNRSADANLLEGSSSSLSSSSTLASLARSDRPRRVLSLPDSVAEEVIAPVATAGADVEGEDEIGPIAIQIDCESADASSVMASLPSPSQVELQRPKPSRPQPASPLHELHGEGGVELTAVSPSHRSFSSFPSPSPSPALDDLSDRDVSVAPSRTSIGSRFRPGAILGKRHTRGALPRSVLSVLSRPLLKGVSGHFSTGELVAVMGQSGCGKTSVLDLLTLRRTFGAVQGRLSVNGTPVASCLEWMRDSIGGVTQFGSTALPNLTVRENLVYAALLRLSSSMSLAQKLARVDEVTLSCGLERIQHVKAGEEGMQGGISGGQKRRLAVALELLARPKCLILDEATSGLDAASALELLLVLHAYTQAGNCCVMAIHQPRAEIFQLFHRVLIMDRGRVVFQGRPGEVLQAFSEALSRAPLTSPQLPPPLRSKLNRALEQALRDEINPADFVMDALACETIGDTMLQIYEAPGGARDRVHEFLKQQRDQAQSIVGAKVGKNATAAASTAATPTSAASSSSFALKSSDSPSSSSPPASPLAHQSPTPAHLSLFASWRAVRAYDALPIPTCRRWLIRLFVLESRRLVSEPLWAQLKLPTMFFAVGLLFPLAFFMHQRQAQYVASWTILLTNILNHFAVTPIAVYYYLAMSGFVKERSFGAVTPAQHLLALFIHVNSLIVFTSLVGWIFGLWLSAVPGSFSAGDMLLQLLLELMCMRALGLLYSVVVALAYPLGVTLDGATLYASFLMSSAFTFSGFLIPLESIPQGWRFLLYCNPLYWTFSAVLKVRLQALMGTLASSCDQLGIRSGYECLTTAPSAEIQSMQAVFDNFAVGDVDPHSNLLALLGIQVALGLASWILLAAPWRKQQPTPIHVDDDAQSQADQYGRRIQAKQKKKALAHQREAESMLQEVLQAAAVTHAQQDQGEQRIRAMSTQAVRPKVGPEAPAATSLVLPAAALLSDGSVVRSVANDEHAPSSAAAGASAASSSHTMLHHPQPRSRIFASSAGAHIPAGLDAQPAFMISHINSDSAFEATSLDFEPTLSPLPTFHY